MISRAAGRLRSRQIDHRTTVCKVGDLEGLGTLVISVPNGRASQDAAVFT